MSFIKKIVNKLNEHYKVCDELRMISESGYFDADWYRREYGLNSLSEEKLLEHFYRSGWKKGFSSGWLFDGSAYLEEHEYLKTYDRNSLIDYLCSNKEIRNFFLPERQQVSFDYSVKNQRCIYTCFLRNDRGVYTVQIPLIKDKAPKWDYICITDNEELLSIGRYNGWRFVRYAGGKLSYEMKIRMVRYDVSYLSGYRYACWLSPYVEVTNFSFHKMVFNPLYRGSDFWVMHEDERISLQDKYDLSGLKDKPSVTENLKEVRFDVMFFDLTHSKTRKFMDFSRKSCLEEIPEQVAFHLFAQKYAPEVKYLRSAVLMDRVCRRLEVDEEKRPMVQRLDRHFFLDRVFAEKVIRGRLNKNNLNLSEKTVPKLIVSLTTFGPRIGDLVYVVFSLLLNSVLPEKIVISVSEEDFPGREKDFPDLLNEIIRLSGLVEIIWTANTRSYKKLVPVLQKYPGYTIITVDDDIFYPAGLIGDLYEEHLMYPDVVIAARAHLIDSEEHCLKPYREWKRDTRLSFPSFRVLPTGCGGVLYPPNCFSEDVSDVSLFTRLAPTTDDLWFWAMSTMKGVKKKVLRRRIDLVHVDLATEIGANDKPTLMKINYVEGDNNNAQLSGIFAHYPELWNIMENGEKDAPYVSVIVPVYNAENMVRHCLDSLMAQTLRNIEIIVINDGSTDGTGAVLKDYEKADSRIVIVEQQNQGCNVARNRGIGMAKGNYVGFVDSDDTVSADYFEELYKTAVAGEADIAATPNARWFSENGSTLKNFGIPFTDGTFKDRKIIAVRSGTVWNKIYSRDLIIRNGIRFCEIPKVIGGDNKFTFGAMMYCNRIEINCKPEYLYYKNDKSITNKVKSKDDVRIFSLYREIYTDIENSSLSDVEKQSWKDTVMKRLERDLGFYLRGMTDDDREYFLAKAREFFPDFVMSEQP